MPYALVQIDQKTQTCTINAYHDYHQAQAKLDSTLDKLAKRNYVRFSENIQTIFQNAKAIPEKQRTIYHYFYQKDSQIYELLFAPIASPANNSMPYAVVLNQKHLTVYLPIINPEITHDQASLDPEEIFRTKSLILQLQYRRSKTVNLKKHKGQTNATVLFFDQNGEIAAMTGLHFAKLN